MLQETTGYIICRTARKIHQFMTKVLADYDITPEQWVVLQIVSKEKNLSQQELAARLEKDKNSTKATKKTMVFGICKVVFCFLSITTMACFLVRYVQFFNS